MEFDKTVLDHTLHDWMDSIRNAVHTITPGMFIIAGVERHRQSIFDATTSMLEASGPVDPNVIPKHPMILRIKPFEAFYSYSRLTDRDEIEEAFSLARFRPVIAGTHVLGLRDVFRRLEMLGTHDVDLGLIRGAYCLNGVHSATGETIVKDVRFFENEAAVLKAKTDEFKNDTDRYFIGDGLRKFSSTGISIEDVKKRFSREGVVESIQAVLSA
jgi:hypothetical protein